MALPFNSNAWHSYTFSPLRNSLCCCSLSSATRHIEALCTHKCSNRRANLSISYSIRKDWSVPTWNPVYCDVNRKKWNGYDWMRSLRISVQDLFDALGWIMPWHRGYNFRLTAFAWQKCHTCGAWITHNCSERYFWPLFRFCHIVAWANGCFDPNGYFRWHHSQWHWALNLPHCMEQFTQDESYITILPTIGNNLPTFPPNQRIIHTCTMQIESTATFSRTNSMR